jgi:glucose-6-phosphate 1-dehydrogenase
MKSPPIVTAKVQNSARSPLPDIRVEDPCTVVIFGGTGDLTQRMLLPGLFTLHCNGLLPEGFAVVGFGRREYTDESYREWMTGHVREHGGAAATPRALKAFFAHVFYHQGDLDDPQAYARLESRLADAAVFPPNRVFYLSTAPEYFSVTLKQLKKAGLISPPVGSPWTRVVIEKPFGHDLASARKLNASVLRLLDERQVYRIDHYLGKETVQNILSFRFANTIFEPVFNRHYIDQVTVFAGESVGMESLRGAYYDKAGALRDMLQNHLLQLLSVVAMEPPGGMNAEALRNEKVKVLQSVRPFSAADLRTQVVRGQYGAGVVGGKKTRAYVDEERIAPDSRTESFVAMRLEIDNWRWSGVPFILATGKRLREKATRVTVRFKRPPLQLFRTVECADDVCDLAEAQPNRLTFHISPDPGIELSFGAKRPAMHLVVENVKMDFRYAETWQVKLPEAYERLLMDVMRGDSSLFTRSDEVEAAWRIVEPALQAWQLDPTLPVHIYEPGAWGPQAAVELNRGPF